ncbi:MFS transporter [Nocardia sp. NPDC088792]|uniref:MFS transporter n=1 Tax=Nocardia sp. NPDC088792 TaxID=3364332 RepID=UPI00382E6EEF
MTAPALPLDSPHRTRPGRVLTVMCAGMFLVLLDVTIVNVALPSIGHDLRADVSMLQWVVDGYAVAIASMLLAGGAIGDRIGHRRVLLAGFAIFGIASLLCAIAPAIGVLIGARIAQGVGGALLLPSTMAVIVDVFPTRAEQARALGTWAAFSSLALPAGPLLGGLLTDSLGWRFVFWINVPLTVIAVIAALIVVPAQTVHVRGGRFDAAGLAGFVIGLGALVFTIISIGHHAGLPTIAAAAVVTVLALAGTVYAEVRHPHPILPLDLLRHRAFLSPNVVALTMNMIFNGSLFVVMLYLQDMRHFSALVSGLMVLPLAIPLIALAPVSGRLTAHYGPRVSVACGCVIAAIGALALTQLGAHSGIGWLIAGFLLLGCGAGLITASVVAAVVRATPEDRSGLATGVSNTARQIGTASGVAIFGAIAGTPASSHFIGGIHLLAIIAAALWAGALIVTLTGIEMRPAARARKPLVKSTP